MYFHQDALLKIQWDQKEIYIANTNMMPVKNHEVNDEIKERERLNATFLYPEKEGWDVGTFSFELEDYKKYWKLYEKIMRLRKNGRG